MECTPASALVCVLPASLSAAFAAVPDPRRAGSVVSPLPAVLALAVAATLTGQVSILAITQWIARQSPGQLEAFGFPPGRTPCQTTLHRLFRNLDVHTLAALQHTALASATPPTSADEADDDAPLQGVAIDGKCQRGRLHRRGEHYAKHTLCAVAHDTGVVLGHIPLGPRPHLAPTELDAAPGLIAHLSWRRRVLTADGVFCQRAICQTVCERGGEYLRRVGGNQPHRQAFVQAHFTPVPAWSSHRTAVTEEHGHGRTQDRRALTVVPVLPGRSDWPGLAQVSRQVRTWREHGAWHQSLRYGITSLSPERASAADLLALRRGHWIIENGLHRHQDVLFREDASQVALGSGAAVMSLLRDAAISLLHLAGSRDLAARTRALSQFPHLALALVCHPLPIRA